jgi:glycyl-tRNA synthetase
MITNKIKFIISHAKDYGFIFNSSEIYDGLSAVYDYGPYGVYLKNNILDYWWYFIVKLHDNITIIDTSILMHKTTWIASGHVKYFNDLLIDNKDSIYRVDLLIEIYYHKLEQKIEDSIIILKNNILKYKVNMKKINVKILNIIEYKLKIKKKFNYLLEYNNLDEIKKLLTVLKIYDPIHGNNKWNNIYKMNMMFTTQIGSNRRYTNIFLRPETAQGSYVNLHNVQKTTRMQIPFGIAQIGKSFRNELIARQFIFRMREFTQMELQFFVHPGKEMYWYKYWKERRLKWHLYLKLGIKKYRYNDHKKLSHYSNAATDIEFKFSFGYKELEGIHSRTDFDIKNHEKFSGRKLRYLDTTDIPYVIETSIGLDRMLLSVFSSSLKKEKINNGKTRILLKLPPYLSPIKGAILPLINNDGIPEIAKKIYNVLKVDYDLIYSDKESIGKRYRIQDAIGTPFCFTIDHNTLITETVTVRYRDTMKQKRIKINDILYILKVNTDIKNILKKIN